MNLTYFLHWEVKGVNKGLDVHSLIASPIVP